MIFLPLCFSAFSFRSNKPSGESQRPNSMVNRTYGSSHTHTTTYDHVDDDEEYDLLDEVAMTPSHHDDNFNKGGLLLDDYSSPSDVITEKEDGTMTDYTTTYDDPIRKQSEHGSAIKLNNGLCGDTAINPNGDIELKRLRPAPGLSEPVENEGSESESRKSQFKGCLCSMNVSAESDIENPEQLPKLHEKGDDSGDTHKEKQSDPKIVEENSCSGEAENSHHYFRLAPNAHSDQTEDVHRSEKDFMKERKVAPDAADAVTVSNSGSSVHEAGGTFLPKVIVCKDDKGSKGQADDDSDYEDTSVVEAKNDSDYEDTSVVNAKGTKTRHVTMPMHGGDFCLHNPPQDLMERLGIRIVPDTCTYETYMALPKSRADLMNPYYTNYHQDNFTNMASQSRDIDDASRDESCEYDTTISSQTKGDNSDSNCTTHNVYDKLYNTRPNLQQQKSNNSSNAYDHILTLLGKIDGRKRLNSY